jgi:hypothetical protein
LRRNLEFLAAGLACDLIVEAEQVVAQLCEPGPVLLVSSRRQPILFRAPHPPNAVFAGPSAPGALIPSGSGFRLFREKGAFVQGHSLMVAMNRALLGKMFGPRAVLTGRANRRDRRFCLVDSPSDPGRRPSWFPRE